GAGSLREAIDRANAAAGPDEVVFDPSLLGGTIGLASSLPDISDALTITGPAATAAGLTISGRGVAGGRPFFIDPQADLVTLAHLTITGGSAPGSGGGIFNAATLTLTDVVVSGNAAVHGSGGGVANSSRLTATGCTFSGNTADDQGGGIINGPSNMA